MIVLFCYDDYANYMYNTFLSLKAAGVECRCIKIAKHPFNYDAEAEVVSPIQAEDIIRDATEIHFFHSSVAWWRIVEAISAKENKRLVVYHTGTLYRRDPEGMNRIFRNADLIITDQCEFMGLLDNAAKWQYNATALHTALQPALLSQFSVLPFKVAHFPSNAAVKGSHSVLQLIRKLPATNSRMRFIFSDTKVTHAEQMQRMSECDIYIEMFAPEQMGKAYGCYGVTAFEAAVLGKIVITQNAYPEVYEKAYGCAYPFVICNTEQEFITKLHALILLPKEEIDLLKARTRSWVVANHSFEASGIRLKKILSAY